MFKARSIQSSLSFKDKILSIDYILVFSIFWLITILITIIWTFENPEKIEIIKSKFKKGNWSSFKKIMNKTNLSRKECLLLPLKTLLRALNN